MKQELRSKSTKDSILQAAAECFAAGGYGKTDIDDICKKANLTKGAFYYHFSTKQDLFIEMLTNWAGKVAGKLDLSRIETDNVLEVLSSIPENFSPIFEEVDSQLPLFLELYIKAMSDPGLNKVVLSSYQQFLNFFKPLIKKGIANGSLKKMDPDDAAKTLFALTIGMLMQGLINPRGEDWAKLAKKSIIMIFK